MNDNEVDIQAFGRGARRLAQLRSDLNYLPPDKRGEKCGRAQLDNLRDIGRQLNQSLGNPPGDSPVTNGPGPFSDHLSLTSSVLDVYTTTGQWWEIARQAVPEVFDNDEENSVAPFGFDPANLDAH